MLIDRIRTERLQALKNKDEKRKSLLGVLIADACRDAKEPDDQAVIRFVKKFIDNARENVKALEQGDGSTQALGEARQEIAILTEYLPAQLTGDTLLEAIRGVLAQEDIAVQQASMGKVMKALTTRFAGQYDGKEASEVVKAILSGKL